jgi:hypothetical protein
MVWIRGIEEKIVMNYIDDSIMKRLWDNEYDEVWNDV